jgi:hypothetical protein
MKHIPNDTPKVSYTFIGSKDHFTLSTPVFTLDADNEKIVVELKDSHIRMSDDPSSSFFEDFVIDFDKCPETKKICDTIDDIILGEFINEGRLICPDNKWAHIQQPLESTNPHHHKPSIVSFVYYAKVPEQAGDFVFIIDNFSNIPVKPEEGMLMIFPGWVYHKVNKNMSNQMRVSISGNYVSLNRSTSHGRTTGRTN